MPKSTTINYGARRRGGQHAGRISETLDLDNLLAVSVDHGAASATAPLGVEYISISKIVADPNQPRKEFNRDELQELVDTIIEHGVLQPVLVTPIPTWNKSRPQVHTLIVGERRWRSAQMAGLEHLPAIVRDVDSKTALELQLVENGTRKNLTEEEEANTYKRLVEDFGYTIRELGRRLGKSHTDISRKMRIFSDPVLSLAVQRGDITISEAQELIVADNRAKMGLVSHMKQRRDAGAPAPMEEVRRAVKTGSFTSNGSSGAPRTAAKPAPNFGNSADPVSLMRQTVVSLRVIADALETGHYNRQYERELQTIIEDARRELNRIDAATGSGRKVRSA